ncbi:hypothetical protein KI387_016779, partial [Taxus chinensis]
LGLDSPKPIDESHGGCKLRGEHGGGKPKRDETRGVEQEGEEKGLVGNPSPKEHDDNKIAGLIIAAVTKEQSGDRWDLGESYEDISNTYRQGNR